METLEKIFAIVSAALGALGTIVGLLISLVKNKKAKRNLAITQLLTNALQDFVVEAEQFTNFNGGEKKEYVMTKANRYALQNKWNFDEEAVSEIVEDMISLSKSVNKREKDGNVRVATATAAENQTKQITL